MPSPTGTRAQAATQGPSGRTPAVFQSVTQTLASGDDYVIACSSGNRGGESVEFLAFILTGPDGHNQIAYVVGGRHFGTHFDAVAGGTHVDHYEPGYHETEEWHPYDSGTAHEDGMTLRAVWVGWNTDISCTTRINDQVIDATDQPSENAMYLWPTEFPGVAGISSSIGGLAVAGEYEHTNAGFLIGILDAGYGRGSVGDPQGEIESGSWISFASPNQGPWRFELTAEATAAESPALLLVEI